MFPSTASVLSLAVLLNSVSAEITAAARLAPRATDPAFVGYISESGGYTNPRSCDYPQTVSTSNGYVQCCPTSGACPFYTACSSNTLLAAGTSVPCYVDAALTCNTAIVLPTAGANNGASYLACWQTSLGTSPFTFVQNVGSASSAASGSASSTSAAASGNTARSSSSASRTSSSGGSSASAASAASSAVSSAASTSTNMGNSVAGDLGFGSGVIGGAMALLAQALL